MLYFLLHYAFKSLSLSLSSFPFGAHYVTHWIPHRSLFVSYLAAPPSRARNWFGAFIIFDFWQGEWDSVVTATAPWVTCINWPVGTVRSYVETRWIFASNCKIKRSCASPYLSTTVNRGLKVWMNARCILLTNANEYACDADVHTERITLYPFWFATDSSMMATEVRQSEEKTSRICTLRCLPFLTYVNLASDYWKNNFPARRDVRIVFHSRSWSFVVFAVLFVIF